MGPGGAGRWCRGLRSWGGQCLGMRTRGSGGAGPRGWRCGAHPLLCSPNLLASGCRLRAEVADPAAGGWVLCPRGPSAHVAPPLTCAARLCVGQQVPGWPRPCVRVPASPAGRPGRRRGTGAGAVKEPRRRLLRHLETVTCSDGGGSGEPAPEPAAPGARRPPPPPAGGALATLLSPRLHFPQKTRRHAGEAAKTPPVRNSLGMSSPPPLPFKSHYGSQGCGSPEHTTCIRTTHLF